MLVCVVYIKLCFNSGFLIGEFKRDSRTICRSNTSTRSEISLLELFQIISSLLHNHGWISANCCLMRLILNCFLACSIQLPIIPLNALALLCFSLFALLRNTLLTGGFPGFFCTFLSKCGLDRKVNLQYLMLLQSAQLLGTLGRHFTKYTFKTAKLAQTALEELRVIVSILKERHSLTAKHLT